MKLKLKTKILLEEEMGCIEPRPVPAPAGCIELRPVPAPAATEIALKLERVIPAGYTKELWNKYVSTRKIVEEHKFV